ncbi:hypothetical protein ABN034_20635 [Actinopolymorpha sp. B11F2]|uniref:hypothetical protein n=1 Tax=Actinopolymorpha sp. B11F2 TaxID=3160862 RepID=UPI0032E4D2B5
MIPMQQRRFGDRQCLLAVDEMFPRESWVEIHSVQGIDVIDVTYRLDDGDADRIADAATTLTRRILGTL